MTDLLARSQVANPSRRGELKMEELSKDNISAANYLTLKSGQEEFIMPLAYTLTASMPATSWERVVLLNGQVVGFIHGSFDPAAESEEFRACIWRIMIDATVQGLGVGKFAIDAFAEEAQARGFDHITVMWEPGMDEPGAAFHRIGFAEVGETQYGDVIGALALRST